MEALTKDLANKLRLHSVVALINLASAAKASATKGSMADSINNS